MRGFGAGGSAGLATDPVTEREALRDPQRFQELRQSASAELRSELVEAHLGLARHLAHRFVHTGEAFDDLVQVASLALVKAVDRFDPDRQVAFTSYATKVVLGELKRHIRDKGWAIRPPRRIQELCLELGPLTENLSQDLGRMPSSKDLADAAGTTVTEVEEALAARQGYRVKSLDQPALSGHSSEPNEALSARLTAGAEERQPYAETRLLAMAQLRLLAPRERLIFYLRYVKDMSQSEIAARVGLSQMQISRLLREGLSQLRDADTEGPVPRLRPAGSGHDPARNVGHRPTGRSSSSGKRAWEDRSFGKRLSTATAGIRGS